MNLIRYQEPELAPWTPFNRLSSLREEIDRLFDLSMPGFTHGDVGLFSGWAPTLDLYQDNDNVFVKVELPGMKKEEINISLHEGMLTISGERKREQKTGEGETFRSECYYGKFHRSVTLPTMVDANTVKAAYKDGILTVTLPKAEEAKPKQIQVGIT